MACEKTLLASERTGAMGYSESSKSKVRRPSFFVFRGLLRVGWSTDEAVDSSTVAEAEVEASRKEERGEDRVEDEAGGGLAVARNGGGSDDDSGSEEDIFRVNAPAWWARRTTDRHLLTTLIVG